MAKTKLFLTETKLTPDHDDKEKRPLLQVEKIVGSVDYTIGQRMKRADVARLIEDDEADVTIMKRKGQ